MKKFLIAHCHSTSTPYIRYNKLPSHVIFSIRQRSLPIYLSHFTHEIIFLCWTADVNITHATFCFGKAEAKRLMGRSPEILHKSHPRRTRRSTLLSSPHLIPPPPPTCRGPAVRTGSLLLERRKQKNVVAVASTAVRC